MSVFRQIWGLRVLSLFANVCSEPVILCCMNLLQHQQMLSYTGLTTDLFTSRFICVAILSNHMHSHWIYGSYY